MIAGDILGYKLSAKTGEITEDGVTEDIYETEFFDANWNKLGSIEQGYIAASSQDTFRDISFSQEVLTDGVVSGYVESGSYSLMAKTELHQNMNTILITKVTFFLAQKFLTMSKQLLARIGKNWVQHFPPPHWQT